MVLHVRAATGVFVKPGSTPSVSLPPLQLPGSFAEEQGQEAEGM